jgi:hypothetical protein
MFRYPAWLLCRWHNTNDTSSFFDEVERIVTTGYLPTEGDVLRARTKTTGIYETRFQMGQLSIQCVPSASRSTMEVGGRELTFLRAKYV